jgi:2-methylcitrate dehydratase PrpD
LAAFSDEAVADPAVMALAARVHVSEDESHTAQYPQLQRVDLCLTLRDGRRLEGACHITSGEPQRPHPRADLDRKYAALAVPLWGEQRAEQMRTALMNLEHCPDVSALVDFFP